MKVLVYGATGYVGQKLVSLLQAHPYVKEVVLAKQETREESRLCQVYPFADEEILLEAEPSLSGVRAAFLSLPDGASSRLVPGLLRRGIRVVDLGGDYRLPSASLYRRWYGEPHRDPANLKRAVYGMSDLFAQRIAAADLVANPGCYAAATILALAPLVSLGGVDWDRVVVDAKSGVSGAGRRASLRTHFNEVHNSTEAYNPAVHDQIPEVERALRELGGKRLEIAFTPHLVPQDRGIFATCHLFLSRPLSLKPVRSLYARVFRGTPFVRLLPPGVLPKSKWTQDSPYALLNLELDRRRRRLVVFSTLDNLGKGAATQAVENFNLMFGFPQAAGLPRGPAFP